MGSDLDFRHQKLFEEMANESEYAKKSKGTNLDFRHQIHAAIL
ncbi:hypothetical protein P3J6_120457 [Pseudoalteromonas sp. 3J6]|nr:hypothetical protein P3J6_120457 [Pseudoalteromonas sp. 3J6]